MRNREDGELIVVNQEMNDEREAAQRVRAQLSRWIASLSMRPGSWMGFDFL